MKDERFFGREVRCFFCQQNVLMNKETMKFGDFILCISCREKQIAEERAQVQHTFLQGEGPGYMDNISARIEKANEEDAKPEEWNEPPVRDDIS